MKGLWDDQGRVIADLIPSVAGQIDLGSPAIPFRNVYLSGGAIDPTPTGLTSITFSAAAGKIIPGATSLSFRNNADSADNLLISDAGVLTVRAGLALTAGNFQILTVGNGLQVKRGTNAKGGTFTANGSTPVVVSNTSVTAESVISFSLKTLGGTPAAVFTTALSAGASFTVNSAALNTSVYNYEITELIA